MLQGVPGGVLQECVPTQWHPELPDMKSSLVILRVARRRAELCQAACFIAKARQCFPIGESRFCVQVAVLGVMAEDTLAWPQAG